MQTDVLTYSMDTGEIPSMLAGMKACTCRYWKDEDVFTRLTMQFSSVSASLSADILRIDFAEKDDPCALSITGRVQQANASTDGEFFDIAILFVDGTETHIFCKL